MTTITELEPSMPSVTKTPHRMIENRAEQLNILTELVGSIPADADAAMAYFKEDSGLGTIDDNLGPWENLRDAAIAARIKLDLFLKTMEPNFGPALPTVGEHQGWLIIHPPNRQHSILPTDNGELLIVSSGGIEAQVNGANSITIKPK